MSDQLALRNFLVGTRPSDAFFYTSRRLFSGVLKASTLNSKMSSFGHLEDSTFISLSVTLSFAAAETSCSRVLPSLTSAVADFLLCLVPCRI